MSPNGRHNARRLKTSFGVAVVRTVSAETDLIQCSGRGGNGGEPQASTERTLISSFTVSGIR